MISGIPPHERRALAAELTALLRQPTETTDEVASWYARARYLERHLYDRRIASSVPEIVWHYLSDADVRRKSPEVRTVQESQVQAVIDDLLRPEQLE